jgi:hypothetical protein
VGLAHRLAVLDRQAQWNLSPPRLRIEEAVLDIAAGCAARAARRMAVISRHLVT